MKSAENGGARLLAEWSEYQEKAAKFFRSLGLEAKTNVTLQGVRTTHDIDVVVESRHAGFKVTWIVECKHWNNRVSKLHVLALREIVADIGADRGILLAEKGFQSGATEAASLTNVHLTSLADASREASGEILRMRFSELFDRIETCRERYWSIPKRLRIDHGLRQDFPDEGYSGARVLLLAEDLLRKGVRGVYPFDVDYAFRYAFFWLPEVIHSLEEVMSLLEPIVHELEVRLDACLMAIDVTEGP